MHNNLKQLLEYVRSDLDRFPLYRSSRLYKLLKRLYIMVLNTEFKAVFWYRVAHYWYGKGKLGKAIAKVLHERSKRKFSVDINPASSIGKGLVIVHCGAIVVGAKSQIGEGCSLQSCVTLGEKGSDNLMPTVGNHVYVGTGAKLLGGISIGDHSMIGANSVVVHSFPERSVIAGIPAKKIKEVEKDNDQKAV